VLSKQTSNFQYYKQRPETRAHIGSGRTPPTDWVSIFTAGAQQTGDENTIGLHELINFVSWIKPKAFGLSNSEKFEIWQFTVTEDVSIIRAEHLANSHSLLPINLTTPFDDFFDIDTIGPTERLIPMQNFASFVLNIHQRASRKRLFGLTVYDEDVIPMLGNKQVDLLGGRIPFKSNGQAVDIRKHIQQFNDAPDTTGTLENVTAMLNLMQEVMPTQVLQQVAGLDRATQYQAAALVQGFNKRNLKLAKIINSQAMDGGRTMQMFNIFEFQDNTEIINQQGELEVINPADFRNTRIEFTVSDGLKGLDRMALIINMKELFNSVLQSSQAQQQMDIVALMDHLSTLFGDFTDFSQFRLKSEIDKLPKEQRDLAFQLLQQAIAQQEQQPSNAPIAPGAPLA